MNPVRVAILGQGRSGRDIHAKSIAQWPDKYQIVAVVDEMQSRRDRAESDFGCTSYDDYRSVMERGDIDLVVNALPSHLHVPVTTEFLKRGFNVLCEKPLARSAAAVDQLMKTAKEHNVVVATYQQSRFSPAFVKMNEIIQSGVLGRIVQINIQFNGYARRWDWQTFQEMNGGNLLNTGPHPVDQALALFGFDAMPSVWCHMDSANSFGDAEDYVKLILSGPNRPLIDVEISSCCAYPPFMYQVQGTRGGLKGNTSQLEWRYFDDDAAEFQHATKAPLELADGMPAYCSETLPWKDERWDVDAKQGADLFHTMATAYYTMLHRTLTTGEPLLVTMEQVRQQMAVMEACFQQNPTFSRNAKH